MPGIEDDIAAVSRIAAIETMLEVVCRTTGMRFAAVARVTKDRWVACAVKDEIDFGLVPGGELKVDSTICDEIRDSGRAVVIDHVAQDMVFCDHPTPAAYGFQSYISVPIRRADGSFFGTLCALDPKPAKLSGPATIGMFKLFADLIGFHLDAQDRLATSEAALVDQKATAELREQFIAVLGHDLRNPLASIHSGLRLLQTTPLDRKAATITDMMQSSVKRMTGLIEDVLDFARGRLGGGLSLSPSQDEPLEPALSHVVSELRIAWPDRRIDAVLAIHRAFACDPARLSQLLSNLLANALKYGAPDEPVRVEARTADDEFRLAVANGGEPIPQSTIDSLFKPFVRASGRAENQGLGLGLYIASEIAKAHGGRLDVVSDPDSTTFIFHMPIPARADAAEDSHKKTKKIRPLV